MYKTDIIVQLHLRELFRYKMPLKEAKLFQTIKPGGLFGYVQCDNEVPEILRETFANFPLMFKDINFGRDDIGSFMKEYAEKE